MVREKLNEQVEAAKKNLKAEQAAQLDATLMRLCDHLVKVATEKTDFEAKVLSDDKSLNAAYSYIKDKAKALAVNGCACVEDSAVFDWLIEYYERDEAEYKAQQAAKKAKSKAKADKKEAKEEKPKEATPKPESEPQLSLLDFI